MLADLWTVAQNVITLFLLMTVGVICQKTGLLNDKAVKSCANLVLYLSTPCIIIKSCCRPFDSNLLKGFLIVLAVCAVNHLLLILVARLCFRDANEDKRRILRFATVFSNAGYMAIPLQEAILGDDGVFYCAAYIIMFNIIVWTYGVMEISGQKDVFSVKKILTNPGIIGVVLGLIIFVLQVPIPDPLLNAVNHIGNLNTPIPMLIIGYYLAQSDIKHALQSGRNYLCIALRLVIMPLASLGLLLLCGIRGPLLTSLMICIATPVATACTMFATRYDRNPRLSVNLVSVSTVFSIVTMPVIIALTNYLGSIL